MHAWMSSGSSAGQALGCGDMCLQIDRSPDAWSDAWIDGWMDGWKDGWAVTDGHSCKTSTANPQTKNLDLRGFDSNVCLLVTGGFPPN